MTRDEFMKDLPERTEAKLIDLVERFDKNAELLGKLDEQLERAKKEDSHLNGQICQVCELLGIHPEMAQQAAYEYKRRKKSAA
jgi:hypothetical protein